jgi:hypothetical protein
MAFGPERRRPEAERLLEAAPDATSDEIADAISLAHSIENRAYELTEPCWGSGAILPDPQFKRLSREAAAHLADEFPFLPKKTITRLIGQAHYFHSK